jgi:hypothetical protein
VFDEYPIVAFDHDDKRAFAVLEPSKNPFWKTDLFDVVNVKLQSLVGCAAAVVKEDIPDKTFTTLFIKFHDIPDKFAGI